jgi:hypothetical protein
LYHFILKNRTLLRWVWTRIHCRAARCGAARSPFDHFEIRVNTLRFELARILKWSNGPRAAPHRAARQQIWFRWVFTNSTNSRFRPQDWSHGINHQLTSYLDYSIELWIGCKFLNLLLYKKCILVFFVLELNKMLYESIVQNDTSYHRVRHNFMWWTGRADDWHM